MSEKNINENADLDFIRSVLDDKKSNGEDIVIPTETLDESAYTNQPSEEAVKTPRKRAPKKIEDNGEPVPFDLSSINVVEKNPVEKNRLLRNIYSGRSEFSIVAAQSGYSCTVSPLVNQDIISIMNSSVSWYVYQKNIYKIVYDKLGNLPSDLTFDKWCQITSIEDIETFFYGIYSSTFTKNNKIGFTCEDCEEDVTVQINSNQLSQVSDVTGFKKRKDDILKNVKTLEDVKDRTLLLENTSYKLPESGMVVNIKTPSLYDHLEILRTVSETVLKKDELATTYLLYIGGFLIPDETGNYCVEKNRTTILSIIDLLSLDDAKYLKKAISQKIEKFKISFSINKVTCPICGHVNEKVEVNMQDSKVCLCR